MFSLSRTPPKMVQNLFKKKLCNQTPQNPYFSTSGLFLVLPVPLEGTLFDACSAHVAIQRRPEVEN